MSARQFETHIDTTKTLLLSNRPALLDRVEVVQIGLILPPKKLLRTHPTQKIRQIAKLISRLGFVNPILIDDQGYVVAGWARVLGAKEAGLKVVSAIRLSHLTETEIRTFRLADSRLQEDASWNRQLLAIEISELTDLLPTIDLDIGDTGFKAPEIDTLMGDLIDKEMDPADAVPLLSEHAVTRQGDVWKLGSHRLLCGDARDSSSYHILLGAKRAATVISDPPYNVAIKGVQGRGKVKHREFAHASGEMSATQFTQFLQTSMEHASSYSVNGAINFWFMDWRHISEILTAGTKVYSELKNLIVWVKSNAGQGTFYRSKHEFVFAFKSGDAPHVNNFELGQHGRTRTNVWEYAGVNTFRAGRMEELRIHPTVKPVALIADALRDCSRRGDIVLDPFIGSGTTVLAAERVGRRAYGMEIDPLYVDAAVRRWQEFTKRDAILKSTGQTFDEVQAARFAPRRRVRPI